MNWIILIVAGFCETGFAFCLGKAKEASGMNAAYWYLGFIIFLTISMILLVKAVQTLPVGTVIVGIIFFREPAEFWRLFFLTTLILSIVGLKFVSE